MKKKYQSQSEIEEEFKHVGLKNYLDLKQIISICLESVRSVKHLEEHWWLEIRRSKK